MDVLLDLVARQVAMLVILSAIGSGPATLLPRALPAATRLALLPALGLAMGAAATVTTAYLMPMSVGAWVVIVPLALVSAAIAVIRSRRGRGLPRPPMREAAVTLFLVLAIGAAADAPLVSKGSLGPMAYSIPDSAYLIDQHDALESHTLRGLTVGIGPQAIRQFRPGDPYYTLSPSDRRSVVDLTKRTFKVIPAGFASLAAGVDSLFGWHAVDTQTAFLGVLLTIAALGGFAFARYLTGSLLAALLAGLLFAGPLGYQLYVESAEGSRSGVSLVAPIMLVGSLLLRSGPRPALVFLFGLLFAGLDAVYGLWVPGVAAATLLVALAAAAVARRRGALTRAKLRRGALALGAAALIAIALSPLAFARNVEYVHLIGGTKLINYLVVLGIPRYHLGLDVIPGWLLQTRDFYGLAPIGSSGIKGLARGLILPLLLLCLAVYGCWRYRERGGLILLATVPVAAILAVRVLESNDCSYCVQRQLVLLEPSSAVGIAAGLAALRLAASAEPFRRLANPRRALGGLAVALGLLVFALAAQKSVVTARRATEGGYVMEPGIRSVVGHIGHGGGPVLLEAAGSAQGPPLELPATFYDIDQRTGMKPSVFPQSRGFLAIAQFTASGSGEIHVDPGYRLVFTRLGAVRTPRRTLARSGPYALQIRRRPFDASVINGVTPDLASRDSRGVAWVDDGGLLLGVAANRPRRAWVRVVLEGRSAASVRAGAGIHLARRGRRVGLCAPVPGLTPIRRVKLPLRFRAPPPKPPPEAYGTVPRPSEGLRLVSMEASALPCAAARQPGR